MPVWVILIVVIGILVPKRVIVRGDDFGYGQSTAETIRAGHLTQRDWLGSFWHRSLHPSGEIWPLPDTWRDRRFPLTNAEWSDYLSAAKPN